MSRFDNKEKNPNHKEKPVGVTVDGTFFCQTCDENCDEAILYNGQDLVWKCSKGHTSIIEDFG